MDAWRPRAVESGGVRRVRRVRAGGHGAVGRGHRGHLPLEELQDHVDVSRHSGLQSGRGERERSAERPKHNTNNINSLIKVTLLNYV